MIRVQERRKAKAYALRLFKGIHQSAPRFMETSISWLSCFISGMVLIQFDLVTNLNRAFLCLQDQRIVNVCC